MTEEDNPYETDGVKSDECLHSEIELHKAFNIGAKAQLKKMLGWMDKHYHHSDLITDATFIKIEYKEWQALLKEAED